MLFQRLPQDVAKPVIVVETADLRNHVKLLERFVVEFVYEGEVRVGDHNVGQLLNVTQAVRNPGFAEIVRSFSASVLSGITESAALCARSWPS